ncbi:MAG TPA: succinate dehydrogenase iron-sulfur subunit [Actinomycetales bacterium]|nr:succinate dehydrogenase iron-sulfur subunit [Actinomycetales bacterium]
MADEMTPREKVFGTEDPAKAGANPAADTAAPTNPPTEAETAASGEGNPPQAQAPAQPASTPRSEPIKAAEDASGEAAVEQPVEPSPAEEQQAQEQIVESQKAEEAPGTVPTFEVTLRIRRYIPETDTEPHWEDYRVSVHGTDRLLDALHKVKWEQDGSLTFRRSCAHGVCGSDAMRINGKNRLACKSLVKDLNPDKPITVEPIKGLPVEKDLVVDMEPFFQSYREIMPFLVASGQEPTRERIQSPGDRERFDDTTKCILCAACTSSCPVFWTDGQYFGPAAIVNAHRFIFDSRDEAADLRLEILNDREGVWRCRTVFNCTDACPRGIQVTKAIAEVKRALLTRKV